MANPAHELGVPVQGETAIAALVALLDQRSPSVALTGTVAHDAVAGTTGVPVNVVPSTGHGSETGHLEATSPTNAAMAFLIGAGGPTVAVVDNDTPGGVGLFFSESDGRFYANLPAAKDLAVLSVDGDAIRVYYDADPATNQGAVQVYVDEDAASPELRLLGVLPGAGNINYNTQTEFVAADLGGGSIVDFTDVQTPQKRVEFRQKTDGTIEAHLEAV